jgi:hypothetical protein
MQLDVLKIVGQLPPQKENYISKNNRRIMNTYKHIYTDKTNYRIWEVDENRYVDTIYYKYQEFLAEGGIPEKASGARFVSIVDGEVVVDPQKDSILAEENRINTIALYKNNARQQIEQQVGDDKDLVADLSKRLDILERGQIRLLAHVLGGTQMNDEYKNGYLGYAETVIAMVDAGEYVPRADLEDESSLITRLIERQNTIGQIVKIEYLDKLKNEGLTE